MILDRIIESTKKRVEKNKNDRPFADVKEAALTRLSKEGEMEINELPFYQAIAKKNMSFICEVKKASPSKGLIAKEFPYLTIAKEYEKAGASAISVLTEPQFFKGCGRYLSEIKKEVAIPVLRKDFIIDDYQIYEAKMWGADAILLISSVLDTAALSKFIKLAHNLNMAALCETRTREEVASALAAGAHMIGVNNRDLKTFRVDMHKSVSLRKLVPPDVLFVSESGIKSNQDIAPLMEAGVDSVLIGESMMLAPDKSAFLRDLKGI